MLAVKTRRLFAIDLLKGLAMFGMLFLHLYFEDNALYRLGYPQAERFVVPLFLLLNGFTLAMAMERRNLTLSGYYTHYLPRHLRSILWPFLVGFCAEVFYHSILLTYIPTDLRWIFFPDNPDSYGVNEKYYFRLREMLATLPKGGLGPGAYYIPLLVALALVFPLFYWLFRKAPAAAMAAALLAAWLGLAPPITRLDGPRFLYVAAGCLLYRLYCACLDKQPLYWALGCIALLAAAPVVNRFFAALATCLILMALLGLCLWAERLASDGQRRDILPRKLLAPVGSATLHIFVAQKVFCATQLPYYLKHFRNFGDAAQIAFIFAVGMLFWFADSRLTGRLFPWLDSAMPKILRKK